MTITGHGRIRPEQRAGEGPAGRSRRDRLTADQEARLARRVEAGVFAEALLTGAVRCSASFTPRDLTVIREDGSAACEALVSLNRGLVWFVVVPMAERTGLDAEELAQEGVIGLLEAIRRYDYRRGRLSAFALTYIRAYVGDAAATVLGALGLPTKRAHAWWQVRAVAHRLVGERGREPTLAELAAETGRPRKVIQDLLAWDLTATLPDDGVNVANPGKDAESVRITPDAFTELSTEERRIVASRFGLTGEPPETYARIAERIGLSEATVRRRERRALELLRHQLEASGEAA